DVESQFDPVLVCVYVIVVFFFFFSSRRRHTRFSRDWSSDVCSSDLVIGEAPLLQVITMNDHQKRRFADNIVQAMYNTVSGKKIRSEERRVGKECRSWWSPEQ